MFKVEVNGRSAEFESAIAEAAAVLGGARLPLIAGLGCDVQAARQAILLAERLGGAVDHLASEEILRSLGVMQRSGWMTVSPGEAAASCDVLLRVGGAGDIRLRRQAERIDVDPGDLGILRAIAGGRPSGPLTKAALRLVRIVETLKLAKFGVAAWSARQLSAPDIEMLMGLVRDLNRFTRFSALAEPAESNGAGVAQVCGWMTGFPLRVGFGRGYPEYDPWRFEARRLAQSGEADAALWLSCYRPAVPDWRAVPPLVAVVAPKAGFKTPPRVLIEAGASGVDHDGMEFRSETGGLAAVVATRPSQAPRAADIIQRIAAALP